LIESALPIHSCVTNFVTNTSTYIMPSYFHAANQNE